MARASRKSVRSLPAATAPNPVKCHPTLLAPNLVYLWQYPRPAQTVPNPSKHAALES